MYYFTIAKNNRKHGYDIPWYPSFNCHLINELMNNNEHMKWNTFGIKIYPVVLKK
jgi:hypothetical protein